VAGLSAAIDALRDRGFSDRDVERIARDNWWRVPRETWA
jgi:microsomal dipeptidase-like Zn-dependent dipeptidase